MNRDVLRVLKFGLQEAAVSRRRRMATTCLIALFAAGIWWPLLHFGGRAAGYPIPQAVLLPVLGASSFCWCWD